MRYDAALALPSDHLPVSIHINYHPEKPDRMKDVHRFYYKKYDTPEKGIWRWNGGEGTKLFTECKCAASSST